MKNRLEHNEHYGTFLRLDKSMAKKVFNTGATIAIMTSDRTPATSPGTEIYYKKGCTAEWYYGENGIIDSFDRVLEDFEEFLCCDGYGHIPDPTRGCKHQFSYWVKLENNSIGW